MGTRSTHVEQAVDTQAGAEERRGGRKKSDVRNGVRVLQFATGPALSPAVAPSAGSRRPRCRSGICVLGARVGRVRRSEGAACQDGERAPSIAAGTNHPRDVALPITMSVAAGPRAS